MTSLVRRELDRLVGHLVDDVERLERPALPRGLLLDDAYFLLSVHGFGLGRRAARAVVLDARRGALDADRAATQADLAADLLVDEGLTARQGRHAELEASALDALWFGKQLLAAQARVAARFFATAPPQRIPKPLR